MSAKKPLPEHVSETEKLIALVNQHGLKTTAKQYDCDPSTLSRWLRVQGYELVRQYRRKVVASAN